MKFSVVTLFPQIVESFLNEGLVAQARSKRLVDVATLNPRQFTDDVHQTVDDRAFGGSDGMVMKVEPLKRAVEHLRAEAATAAPRVVVLTPQGRLWNQADAEAWAKEGRDTILICGRYAGIDNRFVVEYADDEISIGDFILNGGEIAALAVIESVARLVPGVLGNSASAVRDSFSQGVLLECPQFTRPREVEGLPVPAPLLSGHHAKIAEFEHAVSMVRTALFRPDLLSGDEDLSKHLRLLEGLSDLELRSLSLTRASLKELK
jgi:tRNA (guanine37-N1)-methyltransferase